MPQKVFKSHWMTLEIISEVPCILSVEWAGLLGQPSSFGKLTAHYWPEQQAELSFNRDILVNTKLRQYYHHNIFSGLEAEYLEAVQEGYRRVSEDIPSGHLEIISAENSDIGSSQMVFYFLIRALCILCNSGLPRTEEEFELIRLKAVTPTGVTSQ